MMTNERAWSNRKRFALLLGAVAAVTAALSIGATLGHATDLRLGPLRLRLHDPLRGLVTAAALGVVARLVWKRPTSIRGGIWIAALSAAALAMVLRASPGFGYIPEGDLAVIEINTRLVAAGQAFLGPYSRFGWSHPGPAYFWLLAPFYTIGQHTTSSLFVASAVINVGAAVALVLLAHRFAEPALARSIAFVTPAYTWSIRDSLATAWNPHVLPLPFMLLIVLTGLLTQQRLWLLPWIAALASFLVQTHVGTLPTVAVVAGAGLVLLLVERRRSHGVHGGPNLARALNRTMWVLAVAWFLPISEQLHNTPGNLALLGSFFRDSPGPMPTTAQALTLWSRLLTRWVTSGGVPAGNAEPLHASALASWITVATLLLLLVVSLRAWLNRRWQPAALGTLTLLAAAVSLWSLTRITGDPREYLAFWISALGALAWAQILADAGRLVAWSPAVARITTARRVVYLTCSVLLVIGGLQVHRQWQVTQNPNSSSRAAIALWPALERYWHEMDQSKPLVQIQQEWQTAAGLVLQMHKSGVPVAVEPGWLSMFTGAFAPDGSERWQLSVTGARALAEQTEQQDSTLIGSAEGVSLVGSPLR